MAASPPARVLGFWTCLALVVGNMVGSGIYLLPAALAPLGWASVLGWTVTIAGSLCLAFVFARLARHLPEDGGPYAYSRRAFGPGPAFALAWSYWISIWVANAAIAVAAASYLGVLIPGFAAAPTALGLLWALTLLNCLSLRAAGGFQLVTAILKLLPLIAAIAIGAAMAAGGAPVRPFDPAELAPGAVTAAAALTLWAMLGFESASIPAAQVRDPARNIPRATLWGTLIVGLLYLLASSAIGLLMGDAAAASGAPFADFIGLALGPAAGAAVAVLAVVSVVGALNGWVLLQGQLPRAMARDGAFPSVFAGSPVPALLLSSGLASLLLIANYSRGAAALFSFMALLATVAALVVYLICALAALRLVKRGALPGTAGLRPIAMAGFAYALWTLYGAGAEATGWGALLLATGLPVWLVMRRRGGSSPAAAARPAAPPG